MMAQRQAAFALALIPALMISAPALRAQEASCGAATRYTMPEGVETSEAMAGVAPADLPGSRSGYKLLQKLAFDLSLNPVGPAFDESRLPLGKVEIDRKSGVTSLDGKRLGGPSEPEAGCAKAKPAN